MKNHESKKPGMDWIWFMKEEDYESFRVHQHDFDENDEMEGSYIGAVRSGDLCFDIYNWGNHLWFDLYVGGVDTGYGYSDREWNAGTIKQLIEHIISHEKFEKNAGIYELPMNPVMSLGISYEDLEDEEDETGYIYNLFRNGGYVNISGYGTKADPIPEPVLQELTETYNKLFCLGDYPYDFCDVGSFRFGDAAIDMSFNQFKKALNLRLEKRILKMKEYTTDMRAIHVNLIDKAQEELNLW